MRVYILESVGDIKKVRKLFDSFGEASVIKEDEIESVLRKEDQHSKSECTMIVKQSTVSVMDSKSLYDKLHAICEKASEFDVYYLSTWGDACQKRRIFWKKHNIYSCFEPSGFQGVLFTPRGRKKLLGYDKLLNGTHYDKKLCIADGLKETVMNEGLVAITSVPNLCMIDYEALTSIEQYACYNQCRNVVCQNESTSASTYIWIILGFILFLVVIWVYFFGIRRSS